MSGIGRQSQIKPSLQVKTKGKNEGSIMLKMPYPPPGISIWEFPRVALVKRGADEPVMVLHFKSETEIEHYKFNYLEAAEMYVTEMIITGFYRYYGWGDWISPSSYWLETFGRYLDFSALKGGGS